MRSLTRYSSFMMIFLVSLPVLAKENLLHNPGFEQASDGKVAQWQLGPGATITSGGFSGKNALRLASDKKGFDPVATQTKIALEPGKRYRLTYRVRGDIGSSEVTGFQFFRVFTSWERLIQKDGVDFGEISQQDGTEWQDAFDAWQSRILEFTTPSKPTAGMTLTCQLKGPGSAFFDDFTLIKIPEVKQKESLLEVRLEKPWYRNTIFSSMPVDTIEGEVTLKSSAIQVLEMSFGKADEKALWSQSFLVSDKTVRFQFPIKDLAIGDYQLKAIGLSDVGKPVDTMIEVVRKLAPKKTEVTVDRENRLMVNGKPFFPIGLWIAPKSPRQAYEMSRAGFNAFRDTFDEDRFKWANQFGLKVFGCVPDAYVFCTDEAKREALEQKERELIDRYKDNPVLLSWFLCDEPLWCGRSFEPIKKAYQFHRDLDPYRPIMMNAAPRNKIPALTQYAEACDLYGVDIYPVPEGNSHSEMDDKNLTCVGKYTDKCLAVVDHGKPVFMTLQGFAWGHLGDPKGNGIYPTFEETRFMAYDAIVHGATGIMYWGTYYISKTSFWQVLFRMTSELRDMSAVFVSQTVTPTDVRVDNQAIVLMHKVCEGKNYLIAVNESKTRVEAKFISLLSARMLKVVFEDRSVPLADGRFADAFEPYAVHVYTDSETLPAPLIPAPAEMKDVPGISFEEEASVREHSQRYQGNAAWIWVCETEKENAFFRRNFDVGEKSKKAILTITADDSYDVYLNGKKVGSDVVNGWPTAEQYDVTSLIHVGRNVLAVEAVQCAGTDCGVLCDLGIESDTGKKQSIVSDESWLSSSNKQVGWFENKFDDSSWGSAKKIGSFGIAPWSANILIKTVRVNP